MTYEQKVEKQFSAVHRTWSCEFDLRGGRERDTVASTGGDPPSVRPQKPTQYAGRITVRVTTRRTRSRDIRARRRKRRKTTTMIMIMIVATMVGDEITRVTSTVVFPDDGNSGYSGGNRWAGTRDCCTTDPC